MTVARSDSRMYVEFPLYERASKSGHSHSLIFHGDGGRRAQATLALGSAARAIYSLS